MGTVKPPVERARVVALYRAGYSLTAISRRLGCSRGEVMAHLVAGRVLGRA